MTYKNQNGCAMKRKIDNYINHLGLIIGLVYIYQGLVPKIIAYSFDFVQMLYQFGMAESTSRALSIVVGLVQIGFGIGMIKEANSIVMHYINIAMVFISLLFVFATFPSRTVELFNPIALYGVLLMLSIMSISMIKQKNQFI